MFDFQDLSDALDGLVPGELLEPLPDDLGWDMTDVLADESILGPEAAQLAAGETSDLAFVNGLLGEYGSIVSDQADSPALDFIDTVMHASPEQLNHISQLEGAGAAHEAQSELPTPDTLQAEWTQEDAEAEADRREQDATDDAAAKSDRIAMDAWKLEEDIQRDLGIGPTG